MFDICSRWVEGPMYGFDANGSMASDTPGIPHPHYYEARTWLDENWRRMVWRKKKMNRSGTQISSVTVRDNSLPLYGLK